MRSPSRISLLVFTVVVISLTVILSLYQKNKEKKMAINFEVDRVEITPAFRSVFYNKENDKLSLQRFVFYEYHDIKPGDVIVKKEDSNFLKVYRVDSLGNKIIFLSMTMK